MRFPRVNSGLVHPGRKSPACWALLFGALCLPGLIGRGADAPGVPGAPPLKMAPAVVPEELALGLRTAIKMALARNYSIRINQYAPAIAGARVTHALGIFDPLLTARDQFSQNDNPRLLLTPGGGNALNSVRSVNELIDINLQALTPWGGTLGLGTSAQNNFSENNRPRRVYSSFAGITATQPLLRGFGENATLEPIRLARKDLETSQWEFRQSVIDIITETIQAYADLYFTRQSLGVAERSRDLAQQLLDDNIRRVKIGVLTPLDISVARSQLAAREETIITARESARESENALKLRVSDDVERFLAIHLNIAPPEERDPGVLDFNVDLPHAFAFRPDYRQMLIELQRRQITLVFNRNQALAQLDLSASFGGNGLDRHLADSLAQAYRGDNLGASAGVNLTVPLPNRAGKASVAASRLGVAQELVTLKRLEQQIIVQLDNAAGQVRTGRASIAAANEALRLARESLDAEQQKLAQGTSTTYVVLQVQDLLSTAENDLLRAHTAYEKALAEYERQSGRTLERNGVELER